MFRVLAILVVLLAASPALAQVTLSEARASYTENFDGFRGAGFVARPSAGQLDSDTWAVHPSFGSFDTLAYVPHDAGEYARGESPGGVTTGGVYGFDLGGGDYALGVQITGTAFSPGALGLRIRNGGRNTISTIRLRYRVCFFEDRDRDVRLISVIGEVSSAFTRDPDPPFWACIDQDGLVDLDLPSGAETDLLFQIDDDAGAGYRDELALDDLRIDATFVAPAVCGDGVQERDEVCDDGNTVTETMCAYGEDGPRGAGTCDVCNADCSAVVQLDNGGRCGDHLMQVGHEVCDDGNTVTETECPAGVEACVVCAADCQSTVVIEGAGPVCGDGVMEPGEVCDDGNSVTEIGCEYGVELCSVCAADCRALVQVTGSYCGDGNLDLAFEMCDDGNSLSGDGCSSTCTREGESDGGVVESDGGVVETDGGVVEADGGVMALDAGPSMFDGGTPMLMDGAVVAPGDGETSGCAAGGSAPSAAGFALVLVLGLRRRR